MNLIEKYKSDGYVVIDLLNDEICEKINLKIDEIITSGNYKENTI